MSLQEDKRSEKHRVRADKTEQALKSYKSNGSALYQVKRCTNLWRRCYGIKRRENQIALGGILVDSLLVEQNVRGTKLIPGLARKLFYTLQRDKLLMECFEVIQYILSGYTRSIKSSCININGPNFLAIPGKPDSDLKYRNSALSFF